MSEDIYITATQFESGGCHIIEGMACGLIPMVKCGGGGVEEYSIGFGYRYNDFEELKQHIIELYKNYDLFLDMRNKVRTNYVYSAKEMCENYLNVIKVVKYGK
jgi:glycosyltransferase involved in cell wall biosynthesis